MNSKRQSQRQRQRQDEEKMAEECCFSCKDSGHDLRVCNSRNCLKAYHPGCLQNKDEGFICGPTEQIHDCLNVLNKESSEVVSKQGDPAREEAGLGVDWSFVNSVGSEEKRDVEETLSVRTSASCLDNMDVEARPSPCPWSVAEAEEDGLEPQEEVAATGDVCDGPPPEPWAEPAQVSSPRADETIVPAPELVAGPSSGPAWLVATQSRTLSACPSSRALVRVPDHPTDHPDLDDETDLDAWLRAAKVADLDAWLRVANSRKRALEAQQYHDYDVVALGARLRESSAAKSWALRKQHAALQLERRRGEELSAELASAGRALREARSELDELRQRKAASDAAAQESARRVEVLKREKFNVEAARQSSERAKQVAEAGLIGSRELITRLERQLCKSMEEQSRLQAKLDGFQQLSAVTRAALARMARGP